MSLNGLRSFAFLAVPVGALFWILVAFLALLLAGCVVPPPGNDPVYLGTEHARTTVPVYPMVTPSRLEPIGRPAYNPGVFVQTPYAPTMMRP